jgi:NADP-dependent 3-hydroxy acid dehydrogenase YdfG
METQPLNNRIAIVTGASAGIGRAIAVTLVSRGARVVVNARRGDKLRELTSELGEGSAISVVGDAADPAIITHMLDAARDRFHAEADLVVANAGRGLKGSVSDSDTDQWEEMVRTNLLGAARLMREAAARMITLADDSTWQTHPRDIVVLGSNVGKHISPFSSMYGSTKFAVGSLAEALRREVGPRGVRVTLVCPGVVKSEFQGVAGYDPDTFGDFMDRIGPVLEPRDIANLIAFTCEQPAHVHLNDIVIRPTRQEYP